MDQNTNIIQKKKVKLNIKKSGIIKKAILCGIEHETHYSKKSVGSKSPCLTFRCKCKCYSKFTDEQLKFAFNQYYSIKSHSQQYSHLKGISEVF
jgi:hypothetical protein